MGCATQQASESGLDNHIFMRRASTVRSVLGPRNKGSRRVDNEKKKRHETRMVLN